MSALLRNIMATAFLALATVAQALPDLSFEIHPRPEISKLPSIYTEPDTIFPKEEIEFDEWGFPIMWESYRQMPTGVYAPVVFDTYRYYDSLSIARPDHGNFPEARQIYGWLDDMDFNSRLVRNAQRNYELTNPDRVRYNLAELPEPPKHYRAFVDPVTTHIVLTEELPPVKAEQAGDMSLNVKRINWFNTFNASLQFSQAYVSPNWYQGGNNNLNMLVNILWNIKLNEAFHKNVMFETTVQYKLGLNSAPDDSLRAYSISEDLLQVTSKFGYKAARRWYYSLTMAFKTQLLNSYGTNTRSLRSAFLSPGELNVGVGMTYNYANPKNTFTFNASISPLSWNMKTCVNSHMDETAFGIRAGRNTVSQYGSSTECTLMWKLAYNITYRSRLFAFTDYENFQGDWEHTLSFDINRFLSTQIYAHMRYDTQTPPQDNKDWHKFQFKEIFSFGVSYKFSTK